LNKIIGLHGNATNKGVRIGSAMVGKDEVAKMMVELDFYHTSFAKPMYKVVNEVYGIDTAGLTKFAKEEKLYQPWDLTLRQILQNIGDAFRSLDKDFFLKCLMVDIAKNARNFQSVVVSDVRYENEAEFIRGMLGTIVHINREFEVEKYAINPHSSEVGVKIHNEDIHVNNNSSLDRLKQVVNDVVRQVSTTINEQMNLI